MLALLGGATLWIWGDRLTLAGEGERAAGLEIRVRGAEPVSSPEYQVVLETMRSQLNADPGVASVEAGPMGRDGRTTSLRAVLSGDASERDATVDRLQDGLDPGPLKISFAGQAGDLDDAREGAAHDLRLLALGLPLVLLLAAYLGPPLFAAAVLASAAAIGVAAAVAVAAAGLLDSPVMALTGIGAIGLVLPLELFLLLRAGVPRRAVSGGALVAALAFAALAVLGVGYVRSIALGGAIAAVLAAPAAIAASTGFGQTEPTTGRGTLQGLLRNLAAAIRWSRPVAAGIAALAVLTLLLVAVPATRLETVSLTSPFAPAISAVELGACAAIAVLGGALVAAMLSRSPALSLALALTAVLPAAAATGTVVLVFEDGRLETLLDYNSSGGLSLGALATAVAALVAIGLARGTALLVALRRRRGESAEDRLLDAISATGAAAALVSGVGAALAIALLGSGHDFLKQFGATMSVGLLLDLIAVRALIAPALLRVAGTGTAANVGQ